MNITFLSFLFHSSLCNSLIRRGYSASSFSMMQYVKHSSYYVNFFRYMYYTPNTTGIVGINTNILFVDVSIYDFKKLHMLTRLIYMITITQIMHSHEQIKVLNILCDAIWQCLELSISIIENIFFHKWK